MRGTCEHVYPILFLIFMGTLMLRARLPVNPLEEGNARMSRLGCELTVSSETCVLLDEQALLFFLEQETELENNTGDEEIYEQRKVRPRETFTCREKIVA